jgi:hypothetical protein
VRSENGSSGSSTNQASPVREFEELEDKQLGAKVLHWDSTSIFSVHGEGSYAGKVYSSNYDKEHVQKIDEEEINRRCLRALLLEVKLWGKLGLSPKALWLGLRLIPGRAMLGILWPLSRS